LIHFLRRFSDLPTLPPLRVPQPSYSCFYSTSSSSPDKEEGELEVEVAFLAVADAVEVAVEGNDVDNDLSG
jgi:hypothetical protein